MIRSIWVFLNLLVSTLLIGPAILIASLLGVGSRRFYEGCGRLWSQWQLWASGTPVFTEGLENLRLDVPQVIVANHVSWHDVFAIAAVLPKPYRFAAKKELAAIPVFGQAWRAAGHISIDRSDRTKAIRSLERAVEQLREDDSALVIFPEGTRSPDGQLLPFKKGAFNIALDAGLEVVPVGVLGTRSILPKGDWRIRAGPIMLRFGKPISSQDFRERGVEALVQEARTRIEGLLRTPLPTFPSP